MLPFKLVVFDIDGVLTDGAIIIDANGNEMKRVSLRVFDALNSFKNNGLFIAAITGEDSIICNFFENRIQWDIFLKGRKDKERALKEVSNYLGVSLQQTVYIGDGKYDAEAIRIAGLGMCPSDANPMAKMNASFILRNKGGECVEEALVVMNILNSCASFPSFLAQWNFKKFLISRFAAFTRMIRKLY